MTRGFHIISLITSIRSLAFALELGSECSEVEEPAAQIKLTIPKFSEWINGTDPSDFERGETDIYYNFTLEDIEEKKKFGFIWTILEPIEVPKTFFPTPYWNMSCTAAAGQAFDGTASFTLSREKPWITVNDAKPWAGISCDKAKCSATACKDDEQPRIDTFLP